jgi:hypothetical protein
MSKTGLAMGFAVSAALVLGAIGTTVDAATYTSKLEYQDGVTGAQNPDFGLVTIDELDAKTIQVTVSLTNPDSRFINTGGPHDPFLFNTTGGDVVTLVNNGTGGNSDVAFYDGGHGSFYAAGFGQPDVGFTDKIGLGIYHPEVPATLEVPAVPCTPKFNKQGKQTGCTGGSPEIPAKPAVPAYYEDGPNGKPGGRTGPLVFDVYNASGITFAGIDPTIDPLTGKVLTTGTGEHFESTSQGWWFVADIWDATCFAKTGGSCTGNVAARDAFGPIPTISAAPEPATWGMMILGLGAIGVTLRRKRATNLA